MATPTTLDDDTEVSPTQCKDDSDMEITLLQNLFAASIVINKLVKRNKQEMQQLNRQERTLMAKYHSYYQNGTPEGAELVSAYEQVRLADGVCELLRKTTIKCEQLEEMANGLDRIRFDLEGLMKLDE